MTLRHPAALAASTCLAVLVAGAAAAQAPDFGSDTSMWARDGECDDRRFVGAGMATGGLTWLNVGHDASDCRPLYESGQIRLWEMGPAVAATQCASIDFGDEGVKRLLLRYAPVEKL